MNGDHRRVRSELEIRNSTTYPVDRRVRVAIVSPSLLLKRAEIVSHRFAAIRKSKGALGLWLSRREFGFVWRPTTTARSMRRPRRSSITPSEPTRGYAGQSRFPRALSDIP